MGRPLSKQQLFGANLNNNIKVQFFNGTASVPGFIVEQTGSKRFVCQDADGIRRTCYLVDKASADLAFREMTITLKYDEGTVLHARKISRHRFSAFGEGATFSAPWSFSTSTSDGRWQVEEAGTDTQLTDATDLEEDDAPPFNLESDYPAPDSANPTTAAVALSGVSYVEQSEVIEPTGSKTNAQVSGYGVGLRRDKYNGNFSTYENRQSYIDWNYSFFDDSPQFLGEVIDTKINFGANSDVEELGGQYFSLQWIGYIKAPSAGNYNFYMTSDDSTAIWLGSDATDPPSIANLIAGAGVVAPGSTGIVGAGVGRYTVTMAADTWYPIRIWFTEFTGDCTCQIFAQKSDGTKLVMKDFAFKYNTQSQGF